VDHKEEKGRNDVLKPPLVTRIKLGEKEEENLKV